MFYQPQFGALSAFSTIAHSNYNSFQLSLRQRLREDVTFDFNYTYGHSLDNASGLQNSTSYGTAFIVNALDPDGNYASSDFDARHIINANWVVGLPFGRGKRFLTNSNNIVDKVLGGWTTTGIFRWNSGLPIPAAPFDCCVWATNWNVQSNGVRVRPIQSSPSKTGQPNLFEDPLAAYRSFRPARPGEVGDRNVLRAPGYISLDAGLYKAFKIREGHTLQFRWEVFNVTNTQRFDGLTISDLSLGRDPFLGASNPTSDFGQFTSTQAPLNETKAGRVMQFALRYTF
jgi:hypothetical protein